MKRFKLIALLILFSSVQSFASGTTGGGGGSAGGGGGNAAGASGGGSVAPQVQQASQKARERLLQRMKDQKNKSESGLTPSPNLQLVSTDFDHQYKVWNQLLQKYVVVSPDKTSSKVDYKKFDQVILNQEIQKMLLVSKSVYASWSKEQKLSFLINLYNAVTIQVILNKYPHLKSIKDLNSGFPTFTTVWQKKIINLFGQKSSLDDIEHGLVRGSSDFNDPRIHFAFVCASKGCPKLPNQAFVPDQLNQQLDFAMYEFLKDRARNKFDAKSKTLFVSQIFDWYESDFSKGHKGFKSLKDFLIQQKNNLVDTETDRQILQSGDFKIDFLDYDWSLNH